MGVLIGRRSRAVRLERRSMYEEKVTGFAGGMIPLRVDGSVEARPSATAQKAQQRKCCATGQWQRRRCAEDMRWREQRQYFA